MAYLSNPEYQSLIFGILLSLMIPSVLCSMYLIYQFIRLRILRTCVNNHLILLLLVINFLLVTTELPLNLHLLYTGTVFIHTESFCLFWNIYNFSLVGIGLFALSYGCIERYLLIFHKTFFTKYLILFHYIPLTFSIIYPTLFYTYAVAIHQCTNDFSYRHSLCGRPCYEYERFVGAFDWIFNLTITVAVSILASFLLLIRVINQKRRIAQRNMWKRNRRMIIQLLSISLLYIIVWTPIIVCFLMVLYASNLMVVQLSVSYLNYYQYICMLLYPFICLTGLKEVQQSLKQYLHRWTRPLSNSNRVQPIELRNNPCRNN